MSKRQFGALEHSILSLMEQGQRMSVEEVVSRLGGEDKYTTIMTVMSRLYEKGFLQRERVGRKYAYWIKDPKTLLSSLIDSFKEKLAHTKTYALVSYLIDSSDDLDEAELSSLEKMISETKKKRDLK